MSKLVLQSDLLHQISSDAAHQIVEVILCVAFSRQPEGDVVEERWVFTEGLRHAHRNTINVLIQKLSLMLISHTSS